MHRVGVNPRLKNEGLPLPLVNCLTIAYDRLERHQHRPKGDALEHDDALSSAIMDILRGKLGECIGEYVVPPPVFADMQGQFLELDLDAGVLTAQFPVLERYPNPYGAPSEWPSRE